MAHYRDTENNFKKFTTNDRATWTGTANLGGKSLIQLWKEAFQDSSSESYWQQRFHQVIEGDVIFQNFTNNGELNYEDLEQSNIIDSFAQGRAG